MQMAVWPHPADRRRAGPRGLMLALVLLVARSPVAAHRSELAVPVEIPEHGCYGCGSEDGIRR